MDRILEIHLMLAVCNLLNLFSLASSTFGVIYFYCLRGLFTSLINHALVSHQKVRRATERMPKLVGIISGHPKAEGGLGLQDMAIWNRACVVKQLRTVYFKPAIIWVA